MVGSYKKSTKVIVSILLVLGGLFSAFPILWMICSSLKSNSAIFSWPPKFIDSSASLASYIAVLTDSTKVRFFINSYIVAGCVVLLTLFVGILAAYAFSRFDFPGNQFLFMVLIATLMLPNAVIIIPRYALFNKLGWLDSYMTFFAPAAAGCYPFFVFMLVQFLRGLPRDLDESAYIDGCGPFQCFIQILLPLLKPALFSAGLFQFLWTWNDFFNTNIYINTVSKFPLSLALRVSIDVTSNIQWNQVMSMALVSILPLILLFFAAQKYFVEGIATTGMKG